MLKDRCFEGARLYSRRNCCTCIAASAAEGIFLRHNKLFSTNLLCLVPKTLSPQLGFNR
jgi:hypothetical protein